MTLVGSRAERFPVAYRVAAGIAVGVAADVAFDPVQRHVPLCPFHAITGWWCPFCGGLRATYQLAHGRLGAAWHDNALFVSALPLLAWVWVDAVLRQRRGQRARPLRRGGAIALAVVLTVFTVVRNLPGVEALRPT